MTLTVVSEETQELVKRVTHRFTNEPPEKSKTINKAIAQAIAAFADSTMFSDDFNEGADKEMGTVEIHYSCHARYDDADHSPAFDLDNLTWHDCDSVEVDAVLELFESLK